MGELHVHNLKELIDTYGCTAFVETGTGTGTGLEYATRFPFKKWYSIEINEKLYKGNLSKFGDNVFLYRINSIDGLLKVGVEIKHETCLFWLDAHFPGADFQLGTYDEAMEKYPKTINLPALHELRMIRLMRPEGKDVIIVDDLCLFEDGDYELKPGLDRETYGYPGISDIETMFKESHNITKTYRHQGALVLTPRAK